MPSSARTVQEILRARDPRATEALQRLRESVSAGVPLGDVFVALHGELLAGPDAVSAAAELCGELVRAGERAAMTALAAVARDTVLTFADPLAEAVFAGAGAEPALLALAAELVEGESQLLQARVRVVEALVTRAPAESTAGAVGHEGQSVLRFLNDALDGLAKGPPGGLASACETCAGTLQALGPTLAGDGEPAVLAAADTLGRLAGSLPAAEVTAAVLALLRHNDPLPAWHRAAGRGGDHLTALVVDKAIQLALEAAAARWRAEPGVPPAPAVRPDVLPWPLTEAALEATLLDVQQPPRVRAMAGALLRLLGHGPGAGEPSARAGLSITLLELGARLPAAGEIPSIGSEAERDRLLEALADSCAAVRRVALAMCERAARERPGWFEPRHYTRLLPFLSDEDVSARLSAMRTFRALAGSGQGRVAAVVDDIAARLQDGVAADDEHVAARRDVQLALGITMDRLVGEVEQLQGEVRALEGRRRELLHLMETQAVRVGEEIHHEVLNTLTSYLATAIDEEDYGDARQRLDNLVMELRRIMNNLYPRDLETEGLLQTLRNRLRDAQAQLRRRVGDITVRLDCSPDVTDAAIAACVGGPERLVLLYRIVLEAISNARKHAAARFIGVSVSRPSPGALEIAVHDDGTGGGGPFRENTGLALMRRRAEEIGAEIRYAARPGGGTSVVVRLG